MKFYKQKTEIQKAITLNGKKNFYRTLIIIFSNFAIVFFEKNNRILSTIYQSHYYE